MEVLLHVFHVALDELIELDKPRFATLLEAFELRTRHIGDVGLDHDCLSIELVLWFHKENALTGLHAVLLELFVDQLLDLS